MKHGKLKPLIFLIVLVFAAVTLAGWTWDGSTGSPDAVQQQNA